MKFKKLGIALSGGGGKGAYQIGVWNALRDFQLDTQIAAISGSSVGGLNGALMAQGKYDKAESMWLNIESHNMLTLQDSDWIASRLAGLGAMGAISPLLLGFLKTKGLFKQEGLQSMIDQGLDAELLASSRTPLTVALHHAGDNRVSYQPIREARIANNALLATAALPMIFDDVQIDGTTYSDGGFYWGLPHKNVDNIPVKPLHEAGCDTIIVVCLSQDDLAITPRMFPGVRVLPIVPSHSLGGLTATLDFSNKGAERRMEQGYADATNLLQHLDLFLTNEDQYQSLWQRVAAGAEVEKTIRSRLRQVDQAHSRTVADIGDFDRIIASDDFSQPLGLANDDGPPAALATLALDNAALLADLERQEIQTDVDNFLIQNQNNRQVVEATVLDALAALSPVSGRADHLREQGLLPRLWGSITGKNQKLAAENDHALAQAQFAALRLIAAVQAKGAITLEFTVALKNRIDGAFHEIERVGKRQNQDLRRVYRSLAGVYSRLRNRLIEHEGRLENLERQGRLHHWLLHTNQAVHQGKSLAQLPVPVRLACIANGFFKLTEGAWKVEELISLKEMCIKVGLPDDTPVSVAAFCGELLANRDSARALTQGLTAVPSAQVAPTPAAAWLQALRNQTLPEGASQQDALIRWNYQDDSVLPAWDFLAELLYYMKAAGFERQVHGELGKIKAHWLEKLADLSKLVDEKILPASFADELAPVQQAINGFKLAVPLVGQFSVGKSTLLNTWLGQEVQKEDLNPCTGIATEFHYAEAADEKMFVHWQHPDANQPIERQEFPLSSYPNMLAGRLAAKRQAKFIELHCNLPALARHPDLVLVDTPGLGSNENLHVEALKNYLGEGVAYILCITRLSQVGQDELAFIQRQRALGQGFSVLVCQEDLNNNRERETMRRTAREQAGLDDDELVCGCSAREDKLTGFADILAHIEQQKAALFQGSMVPKVEGLIKEAERLIKQQLAADNSADTLKDKKAQIAKSMTAVQEGFVEEERELLRDCSGVITRQVTAAIGSFLRGRRSSYAAQLLAGQAIGAMLAADAQSAFQLAAAQSLTPRLEEAARTLGKQVLPGVIGPISLSAGTLGGIDANGNSLGGAAAGAAASAAAGSVIPVLGTALGAVIGAVIGGLLGFFASRSSQQSEAEGQANQGIDAVIAQMQSLIAPAMENQARQFLTSIRQQIEKQLETENENVERIEQQLKAGAAQRLAVEQKAQAALETVRQLLPQQTETITPEN